MPGFDHYRYQSIISSSGEHPANIIASPDGTEAPFQAHEYGALVLAYAHLEDFFSPKDIPVAREALRQWLWELPGAMQTAASLSPAGQQTFNLLVHHRDQLRGRLLGEITLHKDEMDAVSPHGHLAQLHTAVFLLHGAGDTIIPASETLWLAKASSGGTGVLFKLPALR